MTGLDLTPRRRRLSLAAVIFHMSAMGLTFGISFPLVSVLLELRGDGTALIGLMGAAPALAIVVVGAFVPALAARLGTVPAILTGTCLGVVSLLLLPLTDSLAAWFALRLVSGAVAALPWVVSETWIISLASESGRGRVVGLYSAALFFGMALGPLVLDAVGIAGWPPFLCAAGAMVLAMAPMLAVRRLAPPIPRKTALRSSQVIRAAPTVAGAALLAGLSEQVLYVLLPVYGLRAGLPQGVAVTLLSVLTLGAIVLQVPYGWLADRMERRLLLLLTALVCVACPVLLPWSLASLSVAWALVAFWGGAVVGFYSVGLALLGQRFRSGDLAVANAGFIVLYQFGGMLGPGIAGAAMDLWDPHGFAAVMAGFPAVYAVLALVRYVRRGRQAA